MSCEFAHAVRMATAASTRAEMITFFMRNGFIGETFGSSFAGPEPDRRLPAVVSSRLYRRPMNEPIMPMMTTMISQGLGAGYGHLIITQRLMVRPGSSIPVVPSYGTGPLSVLPSFSD